LAAHDGDPRWLFDSSNAYSEIFTISNTGFFPLEELFIGFGICSIETEKNDFFVTPNMCANNAPRFLFTAPSWRTPELRRDEPFSVVLSDSLNTASDQWRAAHPNVIIATQMMSPLKAANIIFHIGFKLWPWPKLIPFRYRFVAKQEPNGAILWRAVPLSWSEIKVPE
jgi:hypothetical protein